MQTSKDEAQNLSDDKRSNDGRRKKTDRREGQVDMTDEERRTSEDRRSFVGRRQAADWRVETLK